MSDEETKIVREPPIAIFLRFLRFGALAWGGPTAQIAMIRQELVEEEKWLTSERFNRVLAVYQALPGPEAQELCVYFGVLAGGRLGGFLAGIAFLLPGLCLMLLASWAYTRYGMNAPWLAVLFYGAKPAAAALVVRAVHRIGGHAISNRVLLGLAIAAAVATAFGLHFLVILGLTGLAYSLYQRANPRPLIGIVAVLPFFYLPTLLISGAAAGSAPTALGLFGTGLRSGLLTFGGAYTVISFLQNDAVLVGKWLTGAQFLDGIAIAGILPAPLVIFGTFVGYLAGGVGGALALTAGIFLPAFGFSLLGHSHVERLVENRDTHAFLDGITAGVIGLIAWTSIQLTRDAIMDWPTALIFALALLATYRWKAKMAVVGIVFGAVGLGLFLYRFRIGL